MQKETLTICQTGEEIFDLLRWVSTSDSILNWSKAEQHRGYSANPGLLQMDSEVFLLRYACLSTGKPHSSIQNSDISSSFSLFLLVLQASNCAHVHKSCRETWQRRGQRSRRVVRGIFSSWNMKIFSLWENEEARLLSPLGERGILISRDGLLQLSGADNNLFQFGPVTKQKKMGALTYKIYFPPFKVKVLSF